MFRHAMFDDTPPGMAHPIADRGAGTVLWRPLPSRSGDVSWPRRSSARLGEARRVCFFGAVEGIDFMASLRVLRWFIMILKLLCLWGDTFHKWGDLLTFEWQSLLTV